MIERLLGGAAALAFAACASTAFAQGLDAFSAPKAAPGPTKLAPSRDAENFEPFGARVGSFKLYPSAELWGVYSSNIFASQNN